MISVEKLSRTKQLVCAIGDVLEEQRSDWTAFLIGIMDLRYRRIFYAGGVDAVRRQLRRHEEREHMALLRRLAQQKWIQVQRIGNRIQLTLTEKGKRIAMKEKIRNASLCRNNECIIVVFDIPERVKEVRRQFRFLLKECGFQQLQRSVWMSRCDVLTTLQEFITATNSDKWIRVFRAFGVV